MRGPVDDQEGGCSESGRLKLPFEAVDSRTVVARAFAFPHLRQIQKPPGMVEGPPRSEDVSLVIASGAASPLADAKREGTPLPPNLFEPLGTAAVARTDVFMLVPIASIIIGERLRGVVEELVPMMIDSMSIHEVIQPLVVRPDPSNPGQYILVSGLQRLNAARIRGLGVILCRVVDLTDIEASLWEIDENLARAALSPAQEALFIDRRRELHEQLHGTSKARGALAANAAMGRSVASAKLADATFVSETAKKTGRSERAIQRIVQRATQNGRTTLAKITGTTLDRGAELDALPLLPHTTREHLIDQAAAGASVSAVLARKQMRGPRAEAANPSPQAAARERSSISPEVETELLGLAALKSAWLSASESAREVFLTWINTTDQA